jgi:hypothetical protein
MSRYISNYIPNPISSISPITNYISTSFIGKLIADYCKKTYSIIPSIKMSVSQLNIFTFIKDIYNSLKHIDSSFNSVNEKIISRIVKLEENQQIIIDKLNNLEVLIQKINEKGNNKIELDKNLENELLKKINILNSNPIADDKLELKPEELTFANIIENGYTFIDINESLNSSIHSPVPRPSSSPSSTENIPRPIDLSEDNNSLFGSVIYSPMPELDISRTRNENNEKNEKENTKKTETLESLLF